MIAVFAGFILGRRRRHQVDRLRPGHRRLLRRLRGPDDDRARGAGAARRAGLVAAALARPAAAQRRRRGRPAGAPGGRTRGWPGRRRGTRLTGAAHPPPR